MRKVVHNTKLLGVLVLGVSILMSMTLGGCNRVSEILLGGCNRVSEILKKKIIFVWVDASGSFVYDRKAKKKLDYRDRAIKDIKQGLEEILVGDIGFNKYYLVLGVITDQINPQYDVIFRGALSGLGPKDMKNAKDKIDSGLEEIKDKRANWTDIFGSFVVMERMLKQEDPNGKYSPYCAVYYSDMKHTQNWKVDKRPKPDATKFAYLKDVHINAVYAASEDRDKFGTLKAIKDWLKQLGVKINFISPAEFQSSEMSILMKCVKSKPKKDE